MDGRVSHQVGVDVAGIDTIDRHVGAFQSLIQLLGEKYIRQFTLIVRLVFVVFFGRIEVVEIDQALFVIATRHHDYPARTRCGQFRQQ